MNILYTYMYIYHTIYILWNLQVSHKRIKIGNFSLKKKKKKQNYTCNCTFSISATDTLRTINKRYSVCARNVCSQRSLDQLRARGLIELYCPTNCTRLPAIANRLKDIRRASLARQLSIRFYIPWFLNKKKKKKYTSRKDGRSSFLFLSDLLPRGRGRVTISRTIIHHANKIPESLLLA